MKAIAIGYHNVTDDSDGLPPHKLRYTLSRRDFRDQLDGIRRSPAGARVRTIASLQAWQREAPLFLTFDDGDTGSYSCVADELERNNWRGHFFIVSDWIGRRGFMDRPQIRDLHARGHVIGSHTCSHPERMSSLTWSQLIHQWSVSIGILSDILGAAVKVASVANGYYSSKVGKSASTSGIQVLFTSEPVMSAHWEDGALILGRYAVKRNAAPFLSAALAGSRPWPRLRQAAAWRASKTAKAITGDSYLRIRRILLARFTPAAH